MVLWAFLQRGKFRPRLQQLVASNSEDTVEKCSRKAFSLLPDVQAAIAELSSLKGVGPATASGLHTILFVVVVCLYNCTVSALSKQRLSNLSWEKKIYIHDYLSVNSMNPARTGSQRDWAPSPFKYCNLYGLHDVDYTFHSSCVSSRSSRTDCIHVWWGCGECTRTQAHPVYCQALHSVPGQDGWAVCKTEQRWVNGTMLLKTSSAFVLFCILQDYSGSF